MKHLFQSGDYILSKGAGSLGGGDGQRSDGEEGKRWHWGTGGKGDKGHTREGRGWRSLYKFVNRTSAVTQGSIG